MKHKNAPADIAPPVEDGHFEAIVSVFGNKDLVGDIVMPGAFQKSLAAWKSTGDPIPIYWSHRMDDPTFNIGQVVEAKEVLGGSPEIPDWASPHVKENGGLYVKAALDDYGLGAHVRNLLKARRVKQFSFSYDVVSEQKNKDGANELHDVWLHEVGPTPLGANPMTELISAKQQPDDPPPDPDIEPPAKRRSAALFSCQAAIEAALVELAD